MLEKEKGVQEIEGIVILVILRRFQLPDMCGEGMTDLILVVTEG
jgi:hypothetical protein